MPLQQTSGNATSDAYGGGTAIEPVYIEQLFSTYLYTGNGSTQTITNGIDLSTEGGLLWLKARSTTGEHALFDTTRGTGTLLNTDSTNAARSETGLASFNTDGFSFANAGSTVAINFNGRTFASWTFRKQPKFFDCGTFTGNGSNGRAVSHSLGSTPGCIMIKRTDTSSSYGWVVYHRGCSGTLNLMLNSTESQGTTFNGEITSPTSTTFTISSLGDVNASGGTFVYYAFAHNAGGFGLTGSDNVISCGSYTTDGSGNATVNLGYEPQFVLTKCTTFAKPWMLSDTMRGMPVGSGAQGKSLSPNNSNAENTTNVPQPTATGFTAYDTPSQTYIYIAIRRGPMKVPTDATKVFATQYAYSSSPTYRNTILTDGFIQFAKESGYNKDFYSRLTGTNYLSTNLTAAESTNASLKMDIMNGVYTAVSTPPTYMAWMFRRAPSFFDEVCYTGNQTITAHTHNLGVAPELIFLFQRSPAANVYARLANPALLGSNKWLYVNQTDAVQTSTNIWANTAPTASTFTVGASTASNITGTTYVAYLFATCAGVSKVGSYTGTGATQTIDCGFAGGARFVLVKRTDSTGDWYVWDTARGMVSGTDPSLLLNSTAAEVNANSIYTTTGGFQVVSTAAGINASGGTYIFLAIA